MTLRQLGLTSSGRVTLAGGTTFLQINTLALLTRTTLGVEVKTNFAKPTAIERPRKTQ